MSFSNVFENDLVKAIFNATPIANLLDNAASSPLTNLYVSLHTADPGEAGGQTTNELSYTGYARVAVPRSASGWAVTANGVSPAALIPFGQRTDGGAAQEAVWLGIGTAATGTGTLLCRLSLAATNSKPFTAAGDDVVTLPAHGFAAGDRVSFSAGVNGTLPAGLTEGAVYFVVGTVTADTFKVSTTSGGSAADLTAAGSGVCRKASTISVTQNITPRIGTSTVFSVD